MATNKPQDEYVKTALRLPKELHRKLHESAKENGRSYNSEIISRLETTYDVSDSLLFRPMLETNNVGTLIPVDKVDFLIRLDHAAKEISRLTSILSSMQIDSMSPDELKRIYYEDALDNQNELIVEETRKSKTSKKPPKT